MKSIICKYITLLIFIGSSSLFANNTENFNKSIQNLQSEIRQTEKNIEDAQDSLTHMEHELDYPIQLKKDASRIRKDISSAKDVLNVAKTIPQTREQVNAVEKILNANDNVLKNTEKLIEPIAKNAKKMQKKIEKAKKRLNTLEEKLTTLEHNTLANYKDKVDDTQKCLDRFKKQHNNHECKLQKTLDKHTKSSSQKLASVKDRLKTINNEIEKIKQLKDKINVKLLPYVKLEHKFKIFSNNLDKLIPALKMLDTKLSQKVCFQFDVPDPTFKDPFHLKAHKLRISVKTALNGINKFEKYVKNMLSNFLYSFLKDLGLSNVYKTLEDEAKKITKKITEEVNALFRKIAKLDDLEIASLHIKDFDSILDKSLEIDMPKLKIKIDCKSECK